KTRLARVIHNASGRSGNFLDLQARDIAGGDASLQRRQWVGVGRKSGFPGLAGNQTAEGWLQFAERGTIFLDELQDVDAATQEFLRKVLDGDRAIPFAAGDGVYMPDVRLIFATYRPIAELVAGEHLKPDFVRRLGRRFLTVPP